MRRYECITIFVSDLPDGEVTKILEKSSEIIDKSGGLLVEIDDWGVKKLAYEIKKRTRGHYIRFDFCGLSGLINKIENYFKINDNVIKFMTIVTDKNPDIHLIKNSMIENQQTDKEISEEEK